MRFWTVAAIAATCLFASGAGRAQPIADAAPLSVLTYNVKGLPWPVASGRKPALDAIARQLAAMRAQGRQPHLIAMQEAFIPEAKAIGRAAGYRYAAFGPDAGDAPVADTPADRVFAGGGSYLHGEGLGKEADSGLAIFSDYPILSVRRIAYPVCAGWDCLANKGAVAALIETPQGPVTLIDTHLNAGGTATGVAPERSLYAFRRQVDALAVFVAQIEAEGSPVVLAGDFNVGPRPPRIAYFDARLRSGLVAARADCAAPARCPVSIGYAQRRGRDWQLSRSTSAATLAPVSITAPFGFSADGSMLSDHVGITVSYRLGESRGLPAVRLASR